MTPAGPESSKRLICANKGHLGKCKGQSVFSDTFAKLTGCKTGALSRPLQEYLPETEEPREDRFLMTSLGYFSVPEENAKPGLNMTQGTSFLHNLIQEGVLSFGTEERCVVGPVALWVNVFPTNLEIPAGALETT